MIIIKYHFFERIHEGCNAFNPQGTPIWKTVTGKTLKEAMNKYKAERNNHDLYKYTCFSFDTAINTEEE